MLMILFIGKNLTLTLPSSVCFSISLSFFFFCLSFILLCVLTIINQLLCLPCAVFGIFSLNRIVCCVSSESEVC